jgi:4'-phosphopantetheinyl transferase
VNVASLAPGETHVWRVRLARELPAALRACLDRDELEAMSRFVFAADANRFATGRAMLRLLVSRYVDRAPTEVTFDRTCRLCGQNHGKPRVAGVPDLDVSLSGSGELVLIAASTTTIVGVDVEAVAPARLGELAAIVLAAGEQPREPLAALQLWCCKEAILKATGHGLAVDPRALVLTDDRLRARVLDAPAHAGELRAFTVRPLTLPEGYVGALAQRDETTVRESSVDAGDV